MQLRVPWEDQILMSLEVTTHEVVINHYIGVYFGGGGNMHLYPPNIHHTMDHLSMTVDLLSQTIAT